MENSIVKRLEEALKSLSVYERRGLDTSSLRIFIKNLKEFLKYNQDLDPLTSAVTFEDKLQIIKFFLEDKDAFPTINDIIKFANENLGIEFVDQKQSRETTITRILSRIAEIPELKETFKNAVIKQRNELAHRNTSSHSKKELINASTFFRWAEIIKNI